MERSAVSARRSAIVLSLLFLAAGPCLGSTAAPPDPHQLYDKARLSLERGDLRGSAAALARLQDLVAKRPAWDPQGAFAKVLLPRLGLRLRRLQSACRQLDDFTTRGLSSLRAPDIGTDIATVKDYTTWATSVVQRLRGERDALVEAAIHDPEERAVLARTECYRRSERFLEVDALEKIAGAAGDSVLGVLDGDPAMESVLVRFRQLKRELLQAATERDRQAARADEAEARSRKLMRALEAAGRTGNGGMGGTLFVALLAACAGLLAGLLLARRRRVVPRPVAVLPSPDDTVPNGRIDAGRHAA